MLKQTASSPLPSSLPLPSPQGGLHNSLHAHQFDGLFNSYPLIAISWLETPNLIFDISDDTYFIVFNPTSGPTLTNLPSREQTIESSSKCFNLVGSPILSCISTYLVPKCASMCRLNVQKQMVKTIDTSESDRRGRGIVRPAPLLRMGKTQKNLPPGTSFQPLTHLLGGAYYPMQSRVGEIDSS